MKVSAEQRVSLGAAVFALVVYAFTTHPGLVGGDAGELAAAACAGGVAHPPGYPLHGLLLRAVGFGDALFHFNLLSALCGAFTVGLLSACVSRWTARPEAGAVAAAAWLASPLPWLYATTLEVFALHTALLAAFAWALTVDHARRSRGSAFAVGLLAMLALTHHHTALFVVAPLGGWAAFRHSKWRALGLGALVGATPLLLLPFWSSRDVPFSWGELRTLSGFVTHLLRREYGTFQLAAGAPASGGLSDFLAAFFRFERRQLFGVVLALGVFGGAMTARSREARPWLAGVLVSLVLALGVFGALANLPIDRPLFLSVVERFFLLPHLILCAGAGLAASWVKRPAVGFASAAVLLVLGVPSHPRHDARSVRGYGLALLNQPAGALVLTQGDLIGNSTRALQACEGHRAELRVIDSQLLTYGWYVERLRRAFPDVHFPGAFTLQQLLSANSQRPLILCGDVQLEDTTDFVRVPWGLCERLHPRNVAFDEDAWVKESERLLPPLEETTAAAPPGSWDELVRRDVWNARAQRGLHLLEVGIAREDPVWLRRAYDVLVDAATRDEAPQPSVFKNLGIAAGRLGLQTEMKAAFTRYLATGPKADPQADTIRALRDAAP